MLVTCTGYNQNGEGVALYENKVFYVPRLIKGEEAEVKVIEEHEKWGKAVIEKITKESLNRIKDLPEDYEVIGGYELLHMNSKEQVAFKTQKIINDFKQNAGTDIDVRPMLVGKNQFRYRNKITLHDGAFYKRKTNTRIFLDDFLLTDITPKTGKSGEVVIRKLDTTISGIKSDRIFTTDTMLGLNFKVSLGAFYQVNKEMAEVAYTEILAFVDDDKEVLDLYSGIGTISLLVARRAKHVTGVDWTRASYKDALDNAKKNEIDNVTFVNKDVRKFMRNTTVKPDVVIVDPAREGLKKEVTLEIKQLKPERIIYLSCNPATQAADFNRLKDEYKIIYARPIDMFPQTHHVENLIILDRK